ncbi:MULTISPECIES: hypothetical protein [unclassified Amycolatopsis]|uniref:hypothetical protein n=1 Tax=unclassified Amycolatopsis TaxID=2618356 RepID=UPI000560BCE6|nr:MULTISPECIES: hypothetical protein [unclassified Amycolatopsis]MCG3755266.1 hypothetical protein [Amycolatopsis sp. Poz14]
MRRYRNYWTYSVGLLVAWGLVFLLTGLLRGGHEVQLVLPVFGGFCIGWVSTTIARYVYPPPKQWLS